MLSNLATAVSLIVLLATVIAWRWSYISREVTVWGRSDERGDVEHARRLQVIVDAGRIGVLEVLSVDPEPVAGRPWYRAEVHARALYDAWGPYSNAWRQSGRYPALAGFRAGRHGVGAASPGGRSHWVILPFWPLALVSAPLPAVWLRRHLTALRARRRRARGLCASCGYDMRSSPSRCPECGVVAA